LHTTFQQNKDCNCRSENGVKNTGSSVAYDLPAKQGLQLQLRIASATSCAVAYDLPAKQGLQSDSNKVKRTLISDLHTTLPQNRASDLVSVIQNPGQPRGCCTYTPRQSNPHSITPKNFATV